MSDDVTGRGIEPAVSDTHNASGGERRRFPVPEPPALPRPERLNRNALTVAAVIMGVLVLAAVVFMPADRTAARPSPGASGADAIAPTPTYVDPNAPLEQGRTRSGAADTTARPPIAGSLGDPGAVVSGGKTDAAVSYPVTGAVATAPGPAAIARAAREAAYQAALEAPLVAPGAGSAQDALRPREAGGVTLAASAPAHAMPAAAAPSAPSDAMWGRHQAFMSEAARGAGGAVRTSVDPAPGPYAIQAGTLVPAVLVTEVNSDLPGAVLAQVARDVYDSRSQRAVLIPAGSRLLGAYEHQIAVGQDRLLVAWTRVIFPDGRSVTLPGLETKDAAGAGGVRDRVDRHTRQVFGTAALLSLVGAAVQLSQPSGGYGPLGAYPSPGQVAAGAVGQQLAQVATQILQRNMDVQPTIRLRQGTAFNVFVSTDLTFPAPYAPGP